MMTLADVARHLQTSWDVAKGIVGDDLQCRFAKPKLRSLKRIAIDETYLGQRHKYLTLVMDLDGGAIVFVGDGKGEKSLEPFWKRLRHSRAKIAAVAADLSPAYSAAIRQNLPQAKLVFDRFHLVNLLNEHLTELRRELPREATDRDATVGPCPIYRANGAGSHRARGGGERDRTDLRTLPQR